MVLAWVAQFTTYLQKKVAHCELIMRVIWKSYIQDLVKYHKLLGCCLTQPRICQCWEGNWFIHNTGHYWIWEDKWETIITLLMSTNRQSQPTKHSWSKPWIFIIRKKCEDPISVDQPNSTLMQYIPTKTLDCKVCLNSNSQMANTNLNNQWRQWNWELILK